MNQSGENPWHGRWWDLPPLILHPFDRGLDASSVMDSIRLSLHLNGMANDADKEPLLRARYTEFRMLSLTGKDVMRWIAQCTDFASRDAALAQAGIQPQSFADLLVNHTPPAVAARFEKWGVVDYRRIVSRAIGVNAVFPEPPGFALISAAFLENYYAYSDSLFTCYQALTPFTALDPKSFGFALYTSDEYMGTIGCVPDDEQA
jgi:hypothetical protein